jgi:DnaK suppressor protein
MEKKDLAYFKDLLTQWLNELFNNAEDTVGGLTVSKDSLPDPLDRALLESDVETLLRIRDRESLLIKKIMNSLQDIEDGEYGICEDCGREISIERLKARPVAKRCIRCKTKQENKERLTGTG